MYLEFLYLVYDYFKTLRVREWVYEWLLPAISGIVIFFLFYPNSNGSAVSDFVEASINLIGILLGFSITIITILVTGGNLNLEEIKKIKTGTLISGQSISLFRSLLINFTYSVVVEAFLLLSFLIYPFFFSIVSVPSHVKFAGFSLTIILVMHTLLLTVRNMSNLYFILSKERDQSGN